MLALGGSTLRILLEFKRIVLFSSLSCFVSTRHFLVIRDVSIVACEPVFFYIVYNIENREKKRGEKKIDVYNSIRFSESMNSLSLSVSHSFQF